MAEKNGIEQQALSLWKGLYRQYLAGHVLKIVLVVAIILLLTDAFCRILSLSYLYALPVFFLVAGMIWWQGKQFLWLPANGFTDYLNHRYQWLEFSTGLIPHLPDHPLQQLQRQRILHKLVAHKQEVKAWPDLKLSVIAFISAALLSALVNRIDFKKSTTPFPENVAIAAMPIVPEKLAAKLPRITSIQVEVKPPAYTGQASFFARELSVEAPEGSVIFWKCQLSARVDILQLIWNGKDTVEVKGSSDDGYKWQARLKSSTFYQIRYGLEDNWYTSPVYTLIAKDDLPPIVTVQAPEPYTFVLYGQQPQVQASVKLSDDYGLQGVHLVATVSRGSGESVKFREQKMGFGEKVTGKKEIALQKLLDFNTLQMEPGDELYFYTETWDNANPSQKTRSDTYFVQWEDTSSQKLSVMAGLSLDNMPAYFRSQRQIIIDTEKLIKEHRTLSEAAFKERSNNLGIDQKILRLRYGQFLGEEFETGGGPANEEIHAHEEGEEHKQDGQEESNPEDLHSHEEESGPVVFGDAGDMLKDYSHRHDAEEAATLFDDVLKAQLKAALAQMWEAELRLRTLRPKEALPYEYKALELIKSIQQKSRVYVERVGFEPPPLKPTEKRLTGEQNEITNPKINLEAGVDKKAYPAMHEAIAILEKIKYQEEIKLTTDEAGSLEKAGAELGNLILQQPGIPVQTLNMLRSIAAGDKPDARIVTGLQERLLKLLPRETSKPGAGQKHAEPELDNFVKELTKQ